MYDIIGDVHGQADLLVDLLVRMGYTKSDKCYQHPTRKAIFVGDFINRGPQIKRTIELVRAMVEQGAAYAILGNHEVYALLYGLRDKLGKRLSNKPAQHRMNLSSTLREFDDDKKVWKSHVDWLRTLPLFLEIDGIRVVHAAWNDDAVQRLRAIAPDGRYTRKQLKTLAKGETVEGNDFWELCRGLDFTMPKDLMLFDLHGDSHSYFRRKWWESGENATFKSLSFDFRFSVPDYQIPRELIQYRAPYPEDAPIVFFGHYCIRKSKNIIRQNLCCLDSCVRKTGKLLAYRWDGEKELKKSNLFK
ncbi:MAG: metallophosphoesterase [Mangrovibacterium sp.]